MITIRAEKPEDISAIQIVNERAFGRREEGDIVDRLRGGRPAYGLEQICDPRS